MADSMLMQLVQQNDEKHEDNHHRLRADLRTLAEQVDEIETRQHTIMGRVAKLENAPPPDVTKLHFDTRVVVGIVLFAVSVFSANYASTYSLRSDVRDILTKMAQQDRLEESRAKLQEERSNTLRDAIESMKRRQELQQYELQGMKETILALKSAK